MGVAKDDDTAHRCIVFFNDHKKTTGHIITTGFYDERRKNLNGFC